MTGIGTPGLLRRFDQPRSAGDVDVFKHRTLPGRARPGHMRARREVHHPTYIFKCAAPLGMGSYLAHLASLDGPPKLRAGLVNRCADPHSPCGESLT